MPGESWRKPHNPPFPLLAHIDSADVAEEAPTADQTRIFVTVDAGVRIVGSGDDYNYNCLGWACFKGPSSRRYEPTFENPLNLAAVTKLLTAHGYVPSNPVKATCIVTGETHYKIGHVYIKWQGLASVTDVNWLATWGAVDWWESRLGVAGTTIIHERDALTGNIGYTNKLAHFEH